MDKDEFLQCSNGGRDLYEVILGKPLRNGKNTRLKNPFYNDTKGSLCIDLNESGKFLHHDFGDPQYQGDIFDFAGHLYGLDPKTSLHEIIKWGCEDLGIQYTSVNGTQVFNNTVNFKESTDPDRFKYWYQYGGKDHIDKTLEKYGVMALNSFQRGDLTITNKDYPIFAIPAGKAFKIYQPGHPEYKSTWYPKGAKDTDAFGLEQLPDKGEQVLIVEGPKDMIVAAAHEFDTVALDHAGTDPGADFFADLTGRFNNVILCLDNDSAGVKAMKKLSLNYGLAYLVLPEKFNVGGKVHENSGKDISDFFALAEGFSPPYESFFNNLLQKHLVQPEANDIEKTLEAIEFDYSREIERPAAVITVQDQIISTAGNITTLTGQSKSGKSGVLSATMGGAMKMDGDVQFDTCGLTIASNTDKKLLLHADTEQSEYDYYKNTRKIFGRAGRSRPPEWFKSFHFLAVEIPNRKEHLIAAIEKYKDLFGGVYMIVVDGIGDFISSVNDEQESYQLVDWFFKLATDYNCPVLTVLHLNPGSETKSRGHLGSHLERKSESALTITKDGDVSTLTPKYLRNGGLFDPVRFKYDTDKGYHVFTGTKQEDIQRIKKQSRQRVADQVFKGKQGGFYAKDLQAEIELIDGCKERTAKNRIKEMREFGIIEMREDNKYHLEGNRSEIEQEDDDLPF